MERVRKLAWLPAVCLIGLFAAVPVVHELLQLVYTTLDLKGYAGANIFIALLTLATAFGAVLWPLAFGTGAGIQIVFGGKRTPRQVAGAMANGAVAAVIAGGALLAVCVALSRFAPSSVQDPSFAFVVAWTPALVSMLISVNALKARRRKTAAEAGQPLIVPSESKV